MKRALSALVIAVYYSLIVLGISYLARAEENPPTIKTPPPVVRQLAPGAGSTAVVFSFTPGEKLGRGFYDWSVTTCNHTGADRDIAAGMVEEAAIFGGIRIKPISEAELKLTQIKARSWPVLATEGATIGGHIVLIEGAAGKIAMSSTALGSVAFATYILYQATGFFKSQTMPDFNKRFPVSRLLVGKIHVAAGDCDQDRILFSLKIKNPHNFQVQLQ